MPDVSILIGCGHLADDGLSGIVLIGPEDHHDLIGLIHDNVLGDHLAEMVWI